MQLPDTLRVGYVVKRYPRYSETFIVNEILAHEKAGMELCIFALRPPTDTHFQPAIARVKAAVTYLADKGKMSDFWRILHRASQLFPRCAVDVAAFTGIDSGIVYQGMQLAVQVKTQGITHLHAHFATSAAGVARVAAKLAGITYSFTAHAKDIFHESVVEDDLRAKMRDASAVITVSDFNLEYLRSTFGPDAERVVRVFNGLELDRFPYKVADARPPRVIAVGRLVEKKGFTYLIEACELLAERGIDFQCQIIGEGELQGALKKQIEETAYAHLIELLGPKPQSEIVDLVQHAAAFAAPCVVSEDGNRDGLPTVLLEAMALGTPCISTDVTGIPEIMMDGETGLLAAQRDPRQLADATERLLQDAQLRVRLAENARRLIEANFDIHQNAKKIRRFFSPADQSIASSSSLYSGVLS